jgi:hypothetical protein
LETSAQLVGRVFGVFNYKFDCAGARELSDILSPVPGTALKCWDFVTDVRDLVCSLTKYRNPKKGRFDFDREWLSMGISVLEDPFVDMVDTAITPNPDYVVSGLLLLHMIWISEVINVCIYMYCTGCRYQREMCHSINVLPNS